MRQKVELLAPAGDMQCLKAAIHAGADAVYVGGSRFGARAYAHNFDEQELCQAIDYVHFFGKKLYLTLNTLLKDEEIQDVPAYVKPFYETGLDGVIVQDFGVVKIVKEYFPDMEIHASTQMTVTGSDAAFQLKEMGICRVVPARELSLKEIREIYDTTGMEIETFIHGAMCYAYSGQCLFSSFLGGRSGNRGRCAGPCRLPYDILDQKGNKVNTDKEQYPLSLKDLGTLEILPELMESGIASFKIEGRMKSPEYVAGVTSIYRKYIDLYLEDKEKFAIEKKDLNNLKNLYTRGTMETGYYKRHNGREMVTLSKGSYENSVSDYTEEIKTRYVDKEKKLSIIGRAEFFTGKPGKLEVCVAEQDSDSQTTVHASTTLNVMAAQNRPMEEEDLRRQLMKTGNSDFIFQELKIEKDADIFIPNKELNELRRNALEQLKENLLVKYRRVCNEPQAVMLSEEQEEKISAGALSASITTKEQLEALLQSSYLNQLSKIYFPYRLFCELYQQGNEELKKCKEHGIARYLSFPAVVRKKEKAGIHEAFQGEIGVEILDNADGLLVNNLESFAFLKRILEQNNLQKDIQSDYGMYAFNQDACSFLREMGVKYMTAPFEWSKHEIKAFTKQMPSQKMELIVYGYVPLMESANCIYKTMKQCKQQTGNKTFLLKDRYKTCFPVLTDCKDCRNTILNSVPLSLHKEWKTIAAFDNLDYRLRFTIEDFETTRQVVKQFGMLVFDKKTQSEVGEKDFTTGHFRKGVL